MNFSLVIPSYNGQKLLSQNLHRLSKIFPQKEIIVVDDGSTDETIAILAKLKVKIKNLRIIASKKNRGFSAAANQGIKAAKTPLVFLLNNDCLPKNNFANYILPYFKDPQTFAVGCLEVNQNERRGRGIGGFQKGLLCHQPGSLDQHHTLWVFGAAAFYKRDFFLKLGGFDENFNPFYWEDFDLSYRALKTGYKIYFEKRAVVVHEAGSTIQKYYRPLFINKISFRNQLICCWKNLTDGELIVKHLFWLVYHLFFTSFQSRGAFWLGFKEALTKLKSIMAKRKSNQFVLTDKEVLAPFQKELLT